MINEKEIDPRLRFEGFLRSIFDCETGQDPFGHANKENFSRYFEPEPNLDGKRALSSAFVKLIFDNLDSDQIKKLKSLDHRVWTATKKGQIIEIIDEGFQVLRKIEN